MWIGTVLPSDYKDVAMQNVSESVATCVSQQLNLAQATCIDQTTIDIIAKCISDLSHIVYGWKISEIQVGVGVLIRLSCIDQYGIKKRSVVVEYATDDVLTLNHITF